MSETLAARRIDLAELGARAVALARNSRSAATEPAYASNSADFSSDGRRVMGQIRILRAPALVSRARGASQPSVAAERFLMITRSGCLWCKRPFRARRGGSPKRFCCAAHRIAFWSAARRWAERAVVSGLLSVDDIRNHATEACTLLLGAEPPRRYGRLSDLPP